MAHALLSASGSARWLNCPPSVMLERHFPDSTSVYAEEGSLAHELAEYSVQVALRLDHDANKLAEIEAHDLYTADMAYYTEMYAALIAEKVNTYKASNTKPIVFIEERLDFSAWAPEGFGTGDLVLAAGDTLEVVDFKYGKGVQVSADNNSQMMLYALGAYDLLNMVYDFAKVKMTIIQPRLDNISEWEIGLTELLSWGESIKSVAQKAFRGLGEYKAGDHCKFCRANPSCKALADYYLDLARFNLSKADLIADEDMAEILSKAKTLETWLKNLKEQALQEALAGREYLGLKLVEGRSNRTIKDTSEMAKRLLDNYTHDEVYKPEELISMTDLEKLIGKKKFNDQYGDLLYKPEGKPTLVEETDKRPAINIRNAADIFADEVEGE